MVYLILLTVRRGSIKDIAISSSYIEFIQLYSGLTPYKIFGNLGTSQWMASYLQTSTKSTGDGKLYSINW